MQASGTAFPWWSSGFISGAAAAVRTLIRARIDDKSGASVHRCIGASAHLSVAGRLDACWMLDAGCWVLGAGRCWVLGAAGCWVLVWASMAETRAAAPHAVSPSLHHPMQCQGRPPTHPLSTGDMRAGGSATSIIGPRRFSKGNNQWRAGCSWTTRRMRRRWRGNAGPFRQRPKTGTALFPSN
ncbi:hypothetical protein F5B21DRAFT_141764 [Xylaria acuta]|nr:hypothetical protein F5B21DRAFT_141764 [Xylaria acuta]